MAIHTRFLKFCLSLYIYYIVINKSPRISLSFENDIENKKVKKPQYLKNELPKFYSPCTVVTN